MPQTVASCLETIHVQVATLSSCASLDDEFAIVKKAYFRRILATHPDKGGDSATFRKVQAAFDVLRGLFDSGRVGSSFATALGTSTADGYASCVSGFASSAVPSWEFYAAAAAEVVPTYRVELARSNRSACCQQGSAKHCLDPGIDKGEVRIGSLDSEAGTYGRWMHLKCWRVPSKVWLGLPDPTKVLDVARFEAALISMSSVIICGVGDLPAADRRAVAHFCMNKDNWAKLTRRTDPDAVAALLAQGTAQGSAPATASANGGPVKPATAGGGHGALAAATGASDATSLAARPAQRERFVVPVPGRPGIKGSAHTLAGKTFCLTGTFPELGGGTGLTLGKERTQVMIESFGGRVTTCLSGVTDILVVGKEPGFVKVGEARNRNIRLMGLSELKEALEGGKVLPLSMATPLVITEYSKGYQGNGGGANRLTVGGGGGFGALDHKKASARILAEIKAKKAAREAAAGGGSSSGGSASQQSRPPHPAPTKTSARPMATPSPRPSYAVTPAPPAQPVKVTPSSAAGAPSKSSAKTPVPSNASQPASSKDAPQFSFAPLASIDITSLKASRFLLEASRELPYRDAKGVVSLHLLRKSAADVKTGAVVPPEEIASKLRKWLSHAERAFAKEGGGAGTAAAAADQKRKLQQAPDTSEAAATAEKKRRREADVPSATA